MRNENKFSTQKVREIFLIRAPPFFFIQKQKQNSFCAETKLVRGRSGYGNNYKITILLFIKEKIFSTIYLRFIPKILLVIPILQRCFFLREKGGSLFTHVQTTLFYS